jgi:hypothetical protein
VADLGLPVLARWAGLTRRAITAESAGQPAWPDLPLALRAGRAQTGAGLDLRDLVDLLTTPVRSGIILTRRRLAAGAGEAGLGHRIGERRYALRAIFGQDPQAALAWAAAESARWRDRHARRAAGDEVAAWWAERAAGTVDLLQLSRQPR